MEPSTKPKYDFHKKLKSQIRKTGYDMNFTGAMKFHLNVLKAAHDNGVESEDDVTNLMLSKMFIDKMDMYPTKRFECQIDETSELWPVPPVPSELFGSIQPVDANIRRQQFYQLLQVGDVLDCRVSKVEKEMFQLHVIHKYRVTRVLDDLNIQVRLPRTREQLQLIKTNLLPCELIRVAVRLVIRSEKSEQVSDVEVTVNPSIEFFYNPLPTLGKISEKDLPAYVLDPPDGEKFESYADYLKSLPQFRSITSMKDILSGFGIDPTRVCSYYPKLNGMEVTENLTGEGLVKEAKVTIAEQHANDALAELKKKDYPLAMEYINKALEVCPDKRLRSHLYEIKSKIHYAETFPRLNKEVMMNLELAHEEDPDNTVVKKKISKLLFQGSKLYFMKEEYAKATRALESALILNKNNFRAYDLLKQIENMETNAQIKAEPV